MLERTGNILDTPCDGIFITTNGFVKANGNAVMGRGIAKQVADALIEVPVILGDKIKLHGNVVHHITNHNGIALYSFPVKAVQEENDGTNVVAHMRDKYRTNQIVPGWACKAREDIIQHSVQTLLKMISKGVLEASKEYLLPRPGCGYGELDWNDIKPIMEQLPDNFICMTYE